MGNLPRSKACFPLCSRPARLQLLSGRRGEKPCDFGNGMVASPLAAALVAAMLQCELCALVSPSCIRKACYWHLLQGALVGDDLAADTPILHTSIFEAWVQLSGSSFEKQSNFHETCHKALLCCHVPETPGSCWNKLVDSQSDGIWGVSHLSSRFGAQNDYTHRTLY